MGWGSLRVSDPNKDFLPQGFIIRSYGKEVAECVSDELVAFNFLMEACSKLCKLYDRFRRLPGGKVQLFTQVLHLIEVVRKFRKDARQWTRDDKIHSVREAIGLEDTNLTDAKKVSKIIELMLTDGNNKIFSHHKSLRVTRSLIITINH